MFINKQNFVFSENEENTLKMIETVRTPLFAFALKVILGSSRAAKYPETVKQKDSN